MNKNNNYKNLKETNEQDIILNLYIEFLEYIESDLWIKLTDKVKLKNINLFKTILKINHKTEKSLLEQLSKLFEIVKIAKSGFIKNSLLEYKTKIECWEIFILVDFNVNKEISLLILVKNKDKISDFKERVKSFIDWFLPHPDFKHN